MGESAFISVIRLIRVKGHATQDVELALAAKQSTQHASHDLPAD
jgi:hypothetical protein